MEGLAHGVHMQTDGCTSSTSSPLLITAASATAAAAAAAPQWIGGRLAAFAQRWENMLGSAALIKAGWEPEWIKGRQPQPQTLPSTPPLPAKHTLMLKAIAEELQTGVIRQISREQIRWEHPTHLIPKKNGKLRKIMNAAGLKNSSSKRNSN
jgi:hypothetical protein